MRSSLSGGSGELREVSIETRPQREPLGGGGPRAREHDEVERRQSLLAEGLASEPLELVAIHGAFRRSSRNGQAEPSDGTTARSRKHGEEPIARTLRVGEDSTKLRRTMQSVVGREACCASWQRRAKTTVRYGVRRARPLARRLARTLRPAAVAMRARNPWVRLRCRLLGWKVLFILVYPGRQKFSRKQKDERGPGSRALYAS